MRDFTIKAMYRHTVPTSITKENPTGTQWIYTTRIHACDHVAVMDCGNETFVTGFTADGARAFEDKVVNRPVSNDDGRKGEFLERVIVENGHGKTTQVIKPPKYVFSKDDIVAGDEVTMEALKNDRIMV